MVVKHIECLIAGQNCCQAAGGADGGDAEAGREGNGGDAEAGREGEGDLPNMGDETSRSAAVWQWLASTNSSISSITSWWRGSRDGAHHGAASAACDTATEGAGSTASSARGSDETVPLVHPALLARPVRPGDYIGVHLMTTEDIRRCWLS